MSSTYRDKLAAGYETAEGSRIIAARIQRERTIARKQARAAKRSTLINQEGSA